MKLYKSVLIFVSLFSLSGCFFQTTNKFDIDRAYTVCGKENVVSITSNFLGGEWALCANGKAYNLFEVSAIPKD